jgi:hypothetical protein
LEEYRKQVYRVSSFFKGNHRLVQRPYRLTDVRKLLKAARWVHEKGFPASQLYQLRQAVVEHVPGWAKNWYRYQLARAKDSTQEGNFINFHRQLFGTHPFTDADSPWRYLRDGEMSTPVIDLVEIFDYVRAQRGAHRMSAGKVEGCASVGGEKRGEDDETGN